MVTGLSNYAQGQQYGRYMVFRADYLHKIKSDMICVTNTSLEKRIVTKL